MNKNAIKKIVVGVSVNDESFDNCLECRTETPIGELNLVSGLCSACNTNKIKITKEQMRELLKLDRGFDE
tara:strand:+ start:3369 stop:3578 length:210 start_codon:yes stop_codon:yes gene_type:complete